MKKVLGLLMFSVFLFVLYTPVLAETESETTQNESEFKTEMQNRKKEMIETRVTKVEERKAAMEANVTERAEKRQERRSEIAENHAKRLESRFSSYYDRLSNLANKLQARIDIAKEQGKNVSTAQTQLTTAKTTLESAKSYADQAVAAFQAIDPTKYTEQRDQALAARDLANKAREAFLSALKQLKEVAQTLIALKLNEE